MPFPSDPRPSSRDEGSNQAWQWPRAAVGVLLLGLFITALLTVQYEQIEHRSNVQHFEDRVDRMKAAIESRLGIYNTVLNSTAGLFESSVEVTPDEFATFIGRMELETMYAGTEAIGFAHRVTEREREEIIQWFQQHGLGEFDIEPLAEGEERIIITHVEAQNELQRRAVGIDLTDNRRHRDAMQRALATGMPAATEAVELLPEIDPGRREGFSIYNAVHEDGLVEGFVFSSFSASDLMAVVFGVFPGMSFEVYDSDSAEPEELLYHARREFNGDTLNTTRLINVAGRPWTIVFHGPVQGDLWLPLLPLVGMGLSVVFAGFVWNLTRARAAAADRAEQLRRQREWFAVTLGSIGDAVLATDADGYVTFMNRAAQQLTGWSLDDAYGLHADAVLVFVNEDAEPISHPVRSVLQSDSEATLPATTMLRRRDGSLIPVDDSGSPIRTGLGLSRSTIGAVITFRDITERRASERALRESQARLQFALESAEVGDWEYDIARDISRRSLRHDQAFGYDEVQDDWTYERFLAHLHPDDRDFVDQSFQESFRSGVDCDFQTRVIWPDGSEHWLEIHGSVYETRGGKPTRMLGLVEDITERKRTEEDLRRSEARFRNLVTATTSIIWTAGGKGDIDQETPMWEQFTGQTMQEYRGGGWQNALHPDDRDAAVEVWTRANDTKLPFQSRYRLQHREGGYRRVEARGVPILDEQGDIEEWVGTVTDIEEQERVAEALLVSEQKFRWIIESSVDFAIFTFDLEGTIDSWNPGAERVMGYTEQEILGKNVRIIFTEEDRARGLPVKEREDAIEDVSALDERWHVRADGEHFFAAGRVMPLRDDEGNVQGFVKILHDRTAEKRAQEELERQTQQLAESESRFRMMADSAPVYIWMAGTDANCTWFNRPLLQFSGRSLEQEIAAEWFDRVHPNERDECRRVYYKSFEARKPFKLKYRLERRDGVYRWILNHGIPLVGPNANFAGYIGSCIDITELELARETLERHSGELERLVNERTEKLRESHERLRLSERMASLGTLAAGIGHDLGNLLLPVRMRLDSIEQYVPEHGRENIIAIRTAAEYLGNLSKGLRYLAADPDRAEDSDASTKLQSWWHEASPLLRNALPRHVQLSADVPADVPEVRIAAAPLTQAVFNLIQNAGNAMRSSDAGHVRVWADVVSDASEASDDKAMMVRLNVTDDGPGMTPEVKRRCLEPFFSTRTREFSTGLGLSLVQGVVARAGGHVQVESEPGEGATFSLHLPLADSAMPERGTSPEQPVAAVSIDDARIRAFVQSELKSLGFALARTVGPEDIAGRTEPRAMLWVVRASGPGLPVQAIRRFAQEDESRRVVIFGEAGDELEGLEVQHVLQTTGSFKPSRIREDLRRAARECHAKLNDHHDNGGEHHSGTVR